MTHTENSTLLSHILNITGFAIIGVVSQLDIEATVQTLTAVTVGVITVWRFVLDRQRILREMKATDPSKPTK
jgi:hypothetical protein